MASDKILPQDAELLGQLLKAPNLTASRGRVGTAQLGSPNWADSSTTSCPALLPLGNAIQSNYPQRYITA